MRSVLLLNANYLPIRVIDLKRAVQLMWEEEVDVVEDADGVLRSPSVTYNIPSILRLRKYRHIPYRTMVPLTNRGVLQRDNYTCAYCGKKANTVDHVQPKAHGGQHKWENVVASCYKCNNKKSDKSLAWMQERYGEKWKLNYQPFVPTAQNWLSVRPNVQEAWKPYLANVNK